LDGSVTDVLWELLREEIPPEALMHMTVEPQINKPPRTSQVVDGFTEQEFLDYLVEEVIDRT